MKGLLKRGANVIIIEDLCKGINAQVSDILEHPDFQDVKENGQRPIKSKIILTIATSGSLFIP